MVCDAHPTRLTTVMARRMRRMECDKIENDFVERTLKLINEYDGEFEVTLLVNCCLGLIVLPKEKHLNSIPDKGIPRDGSVWGISRKHLSVDCGLCGYRLRDVIRRLRNGVCHFRIKTIPDGSREIRTLEIRDGRKFKAELDVSQMKELAESLGQHVIDHNKSPTRQKKQEN